MPVTEQEIRRLGDYVGATPAPADFDAFWSKPRRIKCRWILP